MRAGGGKNKVTMTLQIQMTSEEVIAQLWKWPFHSGTSRWSLAWLDEDNLHISIQNIGMPGDMRFSYALNEPPHFSIPNFRVV